MDDEVVIDLECLLDHFAVSTKYIQGKEYYLEILKGRLNDIVDWCIAYDAGDNTLCDIYGVTKLYNCMIRYYDFTNFHSHLVVVDNAGFDYICDGLADFLSDKEEVVFKVIYDYINDVLENKSVKWSKALHTYIRMSKTYTFLGFDRYENCLLSENEFVRAWVDEYWPKRDTLTYTLKDGTTCSVEFTNSWNVDHISLNGTCYVGLSALRQFYAMKRSGVFDHV